MSGNDTTNTNDDKIQDIINNLQEVESELHRVLQRHKDGKYGYITKRWGFTTPNGLGGPLGGKFKPWEDKLAQVPSFFWPIEAYESMEDGPRYGKVDDIIEVEEKLGVLLREEAEQLKGNTPLHEFLHQPPKQAVILEDSDLKEYKDAARILMLLGTLSHLCGNSGVKGTPLPTWIEDPLVQTAQRLNVEPSASAHFLLQENWIWKTSKESSEDDNKASTPAANKDPRKQFASTNKRDKQQRRDQSILRALLEGCEVQNRRYRLKVYHDCFLGQQAIDVLMDGGFAESRDEAVSLGRRINKDHKLFVHATNDHPLMDKYLFYRFRNKWERKRVGGNLEQALLEEDDEDDDDDEYEEKSEYLAPSRSSRMLRPSDLLTPKSKSKSIDISGSRVSDVSNLSEDEPLRLSLQRLSSRSLPAVDASRRLLEDHNEDMMQETNMNLVPDDSILSEAMVAIGAMRRVKVKDRRYRLKVYKNCFVGSQLIDVLMELEVARTRAEALKIAAAVNKRFGFFEHVCQDHAIKDEYLFYRFTGSFKEVMMDSNGPTGLTEDIISNPDSDATPKRLRFMKDTIKGSRDFGDNGDNDSVSEVGSLVSYDTYYGAEAPEEEEFRFENIDMLYPAFRNNHEKVNQLVPVLMGYSFRSLPYLVLDILASMRYLLELETDLGDDASRDSFEARRLSDLLHQLAFCASRCKEQFQLITTDQTKRTFLSKYVSIKQTQPLASGVYVRREKGGEPLPTKGNTGTQFPHFHLLDWLLGRHQTSSGTGLVAQISTLDDSYPPPQRDYIQALSKLQKQSTLRYFLDAIGRPKKTVAAYNHLLECYAGESGVLQAHCRKLYSYIHNDCQFSTSGTNHLKNASGEADACPMSSAHDNHLFAQMMFKHMRDACEDRWRLRVPPLMTEVKKIVYSTSESGGFTTVALELTNTGLLYEYGDVARVLLPNSHKATYAWSKSLSSALKEYFTLEDMVGLHKDKVNGWGWPDLWEALGWGRYEEDGGVGVPLELIAAYIERGHIRDGRGRSRWCNSSLDLVTDSDQKLFAVPPPLEHQQIMSLEPVSPRIYSVSGVESDRVFLLVSKPQDGARHHGYEGMSNPHLDTVYCSISPATFFLLPPIGVNLVCVASGTGISPFVGLADAIGSRPGRYTIAHQCKSSDLFLSNSQAWLDFTAINPGAVVMGFISGDRSRRNCPMRYTIRNGAFEETTALGRHSSSAYYFECPCFQARLREVYKAGGLNLAYCCGGYTSAVQPLKNIFSDEGVEYEFTIECYAVSSTLRANSTAGQINGSIVNLDHVAPIHPGGDQILQQAHAIAKEISTRNPGATNSSTSTPDHSIAFWQLHPHAYNMHRCLRTPIDADSEAFAAFLQRQAMSKSVTVGMAERYAEVALSAPEDSKVVRIAAELQSSAIRQQMQSGDTEGAKKSGETLGRILDALKGSDTDGNRWNKTLDDLNGV